MARLYEYLVFYHSVKDIQKGSPIDEQWLRTWLKELLLEDEFNDVHESFKSYYPKFKQFVEQVRNGA